MSGDIRGGSGTGQDAAGAGGCSCDEAVEHLWEYLDDELGTEEATRIRVHLEGGCTPCVGERDLDVAIKVVVRRGCREQAPEELRLRVLEQITALRVAAGSPTA